MKTSFPKRSRGMSQIIEPEDESNALRSSITTEGFHYFKQEEQLKKYKKMVRDMQGIIKQQKQKREQMQQKIQMLTARNILRQKQFHSILKANLDVLKKLDKSDEQSSKMQLVKVFDKIFSNFDDMNHATTNFIQNRYNQNMKSMETRISNIMTILNEEISKMNKVRNIDRFDMQKKIQEVIHIAKKIQQENYKNKQKIQNQSLKNRLLQEEKQLLIQEVIQKKQLILKLYMENKKLREQKQSPGNSFNHSSPEPTQKKKSLLSSTQRTHCESYYVKSKQQAQEKSKKEFPIVEFQASKTQQFITQSFTKNNQSGFAGKNRYTSARGPNNKGQRQGARSLNFSKKIQEQTNINYKQADYEKIIEHLKLSLDREKKKSQQFSRLLNKLQAQNEQINSSISQIIKQYKKENKDGKALQVLVKSEKLFQIIRSLKQRLSMLERPSFSCGWGENPIQNQLFAQIAENLKNEKSN